MLYFYDARFHFFESHMESQYICPTKASQKCARLGEFKLEVVSNVWDLSLLYQKRTRSINSQGFGFGRRMLDLCLVVEIEGLWIFVRPFSLAPSLYISLQFATSSFMNCTFFNKNIQPLQSWPLLLKHQTLLMKPPGASKQVVLRPHDISRILREIHFFHLGQAFQPSTSIGKSTSPG